MSDSLTQKEKRLRQFKTMAAKARFMHHGTRCNAPNPKVRSVNVVLYFSLNSGKKRTEFPLKTDCFLGSKPYITFPAIKTRIQPTQRLHAGVHGSTGHPPGAYQPAQSNTKSIKQ